MSFKQENPRSPRGFSHSAPLPIISKTQNYPASSLHSSGFDSETAWHSASRHDPSAPDRSCSPHSPSSRLQSPRATDAPHSSSNSVPVPCFTSLELKMAAPHLRLSPKFDSDAIATIVLFMRRCTRLTPTQLPLFTYSCFCFFAPLFCTLRQPLRQETKR